MATIGEKRVRAQFNPSKDYTVQTIKQKASELIDLIHSLEPKEDLGADIGEFIRLKSIACTDVETAAMYAVKCATFTKYPD